MARGKWTAVRGRAGDQLTGVQSSVELDHSDGATVPDDLRDEQQELLQECIIHSDGATVPAARRLLVLSSKYGAAVSLRSTVGATRGTERRAYLLKEAHGPELRCARDSHGPG